MKKVLIYYRTSKKKSKVILQKRICRKYCKKNKLKIVEEYFDDGYSGMRKNRPALNKLLGDINSKIDFVLVYKVDRLGRKFPHLNKLIGDFEDQGIKFVSATQNHDSSTPEGKFMLRILMSLAEFESGIISTRILDGLSAKKRK